MGFTDREIARQDTTHSGVVNLLLGFCYESELKNKFIFGGSWTVIFVDTTI